MERDLIERFDNILPVMNPSISNGLAIEHTKHAVTYVVKALESVFRNKPQGVCFEGWSWATPRKEYLEFSKKRKSRGKQKTTRRMFELARSTKRMIEVNFSHNGLRLDPFYLALPFSTMQGDIFVRGTGYDATPVLTDPVFSVGIDNVFTRLLRAKVTFKKEVHHFSIDGKRQLAQVIWSKIHNAKPPSNVARLVTCGTPILVYTFCKMGFSEAFKLFTGKVPIVGDHNSINTRNYPPSDWVICKTGMIGKPAKTCRIKDYVPTKLCIAVRREDFDTKMKNMVGSFFYIVDHLPNYMSVELVEDTDTWQLILGYMLFAYEDGVGKLRSRIRSHMASLDNYIDTIVEAKLKDLGYECSDLFTLFRIIVDNFTSWMQDASDKIVSMYDKELNLLYWMLMDVTDNICNLYFKFTASENVMPLSEIKKTISTQLNTGLFFKLSSGHAELSVTSTSSSCKVFKVTSGLVSQSDTTRSKNKGAGGKKGGKARTAIDAPERACHVSLVEITSHLFVQKSEGTGRKRLNPFVQVDSKGVILRDEKIRPLLDYTQRKIAAR